MSTILNKMGYHQNLPRYMVFVPKQMGGVGLHNLCHEMELQQIMILICHLQANTQLGKVIQILLCTYQLWAGLSELVLLDTRECPWIPDCWILRIHQTLNDYRIQIQVNMWVVPPICLNDCHIMEAIMDLNLNPLQMQMINACHMYLRVNTLAKITSHTGKCLLPDATSCSKNQPPKGLQDISQSLLDWPTVHLPSQSCWKVWICTIKSLFTGDTKGEYLQTPLGIWLKPYQNHRFWKWQISPLGSLLYQNDLGSRP